MMDDIFGNRADQYFLIAYFHNDTVYLTMEIPPMVANNPPITLNSIYKKK